MNSMPTMAITGATGFIGRALTQHFLARDWRIVALGRRAPDAPAPGVVHRRFDLADPRLDGDALAGVDVLVHGAYVKASRDVDAFAVNTAAAAVLREAAAHAGVGHAIFISSVSAHDEAVSDYGRQKYAIERSVFASPADAIVRPGLVLGHGGLFANMRRHIEQGGRVPLFGGGGQPMQSVHVDDLAAALGVIVERRLGGTFSICEPQPMTYREFYTALSESLGRRPRFVPVPFWVMSGVLRAADMAGLRLPVNHDNLLGLKTARVIDSGPSLARLGLHLRSGRESLELLARQPGPRG